MWTWFYCAIFIFNCCFSSYKAESAFQWDVKNCRHNEILFDPEKRVYLDAKETFGPPRTEGLEHCIAIFDHDQGEFKNYEIKAEMLSLESSEGSNSGNIGLVFNYMDDENYDFVYLKIHRNSSGRLVSGYLLNGVLTEDENVPINRSISGTIFHSLRLVVDNRSLMSTRVYLDDQFIGSVQEHFVPRLKGGVFILNRFEGVALFKNFSLRECNNFGQNGTCLEVDCKWGEFDGWSRCSKTCGNGIKIRNRSIVNAAQNGGKDCEGDAKEVKTCNEQDCPPIPARIVIQSHAKGMGANFARSWNEYKDGFGTIRQKNFWIGLEKMHNLTDSGLYGLQVAIKENDGVLRTVEYDSFRVSDEYDKYRLYLSGFRPGTSGLADRLAYHNSRPFTTVDRDNDEYGTNCAHNYGNSGWWYGSCYSSNLNHASGPTWTATSRYELESKMTLIKK